MNRQCCVWNGWNEIADHTWQELLEVLQSHQRRGIRRVVFDRMNPFLAMTDTEFISRFRLRKETIHALIQEIQDQLPVSLDRRGAPVPPHLQVLIAIRCMASGGHQITLGDCFDVSQARVSQCLALVSRAIASKSGKYICFPGSDDRHKTIQDFNEIDRMPGVIGCIDCTHIAILRPPCENPELFRNRKGYFSLNVQAICGPDLTFYNVVTRWPGSVHDSRIFENSQICGALEEGMLPGHLLGDSGYPCRKYLLTPLANPRNEHEEAYNRSHIKTRNTIERAFGVVKKLFAYLGMVIRVRLDTAQAIIVSSFILHNIAVKTKVLLPEEELDMVQENNLNVDRNDDAEINLHVQGRLKREQIIRDHF